MGRISIIADQSHNDQSLPKGNPTSIGEKAGDVFFVIETRFRRSHTMTVIASSPIQSDQSQPWQEINRLVREIFRARRYPHSQARQCCYSAERSGSLGSHCLSQLVQSAQVSQVICVLRNSLSHSPSVNPETYRNQLQEKKVFILRSCMV